MGVVMYDIAQRASHICTQIQIWGHNMHAEHGCAVDWKFH